ncbi:MAG: tetratricopeptide repeat protein [Thermodesulfobacterium sp.]|nr:tetratricopeptide repeat protein [Thermodesulfobacterium sp.]
MEHKEEKQGKDGMPRFARQDRTEESEKLRIAQELVEKGNSAWVKGQILDAIQSFESALEIYSELGRMAEMANILEKLGDIYYLRQNFEKALRAYKACLDICENFEDEISTCIIAEKIAHVLRDKGEYERCLPYFYRILEIAEKYKDPHRAGRALAGIGECCLKLNRFEQAKDALKLALKIFKGMGAIEQTKVLEAALERLEKGLDKPPLDSE